MNLLLKDENILAVGMMSRAIGQLVGRFTHLEYLGFVISDFIEGNLTNLSLTLNLAYMIRKRKRQRERSHVLGMTPYAGFPVSLFLDGIS